MSSKADKTHKDLRSKLRRGFGTSEFAVVLLAILSLVVLFNPFSEEVLTVAPALSFLAAFALFMVPGFVLALALLPGPDLAGPARVPVAFSLSAGVFGLAALSTLVLGKSLACYPTICGGILALALGFAVVRIVRDTIPTKGGRRSAVDLSTALLWAPFLLLTGMLAWISAVNVPRPAADAWVYLSRVRELLESGELAGGFSRLTMNGWLPEQSMLSSISGLDPIALVLRHLAPTLVVVALLALYALARTLLKNEKAALVICSLSASFFLAGLGSASLDSNLAPGEEIANFITEDKFVARYVFLPVALSLAILFVRHRRWRNLGLFFLVCLSVAVVHPLGLAFIGIPVAGFGLIRLAMNWRDRGARWGIGGLWLVLLILTGPPALYLLATGSPLLFKLDAVNPDTAVTLIETWQYERRLLEIGEGTYVAHPSLLLDPAMLAVYLLGVPFLIWKAKRARDGSAAQLLLGTLAFAPVLTFVPHTATLISNVIGPWILYRLTWPLLFAALLTLGWVCWEALRLLGTGLSGYNLTRPVAPFLPLIVVGLLLIDAVPLALTGFRAADDANKFAQDESSCLDPALRWMQGAIPASGKVMAPRTENSCMMAYASSVDVLGTRGKIPPRALQDLDDFYAGPALGPEALQILERRKIGYVVLPVNSPLNVQLEHLPGLSRMNNPGQRYRVYEVTDRQRAFEPTPAVVANGYLNDQRWGAAIEAYTEASEGEQEDDDRFLAYLGLGRAYTGKGQYAEAAQNYQAALELDPESSVAHDLLANVYNAAGEKDQAKTEFERAIELDPDNADLRLRYGRFLVAVDRGEAVEQHLAVAQTYPEVPEYRVKLGSALMLAGDPKAADEQFERAIRLDPLSPRIQADVGGANLTSGRPEKALRYYDTALKLDPNSQLYALNLAKAHAQLSTLNGRDEEHFEEAEALFRRVEELGHQPWDPDQREAARIALGDLYLQWDRPEDATTAYEQALELNPDSEEAKKKLDELRQEKET